jgi:hypothetical protein
MITESVAYCIGREYAMVCMCRALPLRLPCVTLGSAAGMPAGAVCPGVMLGWRAACAWLPDLRCCAVAELDAMISHPMRVLDGHGG